MNYKKIEEKIYDILDDEDVTLNYIVDFLFKTFKNYDWIGVYIVNPICLKGVNNNQRQYDRKNNSNNR